MKFYLAVTLPSWIVVIVYFAVSPEGALGAAIGMAFTWQVIAGDVLQLKPKREDK